MGIERGVSKSLTGKKQPTTGRILGLEEERLKREKLEEEKRLKRLKLLETGGYGQEYLKEIATGRKQIFGE